MTTRSIDNIAVGKRYRQSVGDLTSLVTSIQDVGLLHPIVIDPSGLLIAGQRRLEACRKLGWVEVPVRILDLDATLALQGQHDENVIRQDFLPTEAVDIVRAREGIEQKAARKRQLASLKQGNSTPVTEIFRNGEKGESADKAAAVVGWSGKTYQKAKAVVEAAEEDPDLFGDLPDRMDASGKVDGAYKELKKRKRQADQPTVNYNPETLEWPDFIQLIHGNFADVAQTLDAESFGLIITDPPYPKEYLHLYGLLAKESAYLLQSGGSLLAMAGQSYLPEILSMLGEYLSYHWVISYDTPGGQSPQIWPRKINAFWKPVLWYTKGKYQGPWHGDKIKSDVNDNDKRFHGWGQSESGIGKLVAEFTSSDSGKVLDPFLGGGTTAVVCYRLRIPFVGIDIDKQAIETTKERIWQEVHHGTQGIQP